MTDSLPPVPATTPDETGLRAILRARLDHREVDERVRRLVLAAFDGAEVLAGELYGRALGERLKQPAGPARGREGHAYLRSIGVRAFRGIGAQTFLRLQPGPGLTLIIGRNGSGKSSLAEAAEVALTGANSRWEGRTAAWKDGWRNLHTDEDPEVRLELAQATGMMTLIRTWSGKNVERSTCVVERPGEEPRHLRELGWAQDLSVYRPFLPYADLGRLVSAKQSEVHDAVCAILGLDDLAAAEVRLRDARTQLRARDRHVRDELVTLFAELQLMDDERALTAAAALSRSPWDLDSAAALVVGDQPQAQVSHLRFLTQLSPPEEEQLDEAAAELKAAANEIDQTRGATAPIDVADLLERALTYHEQHPGRAACPVCRTENVLDEAWAEQAATAAARLRATAHEVARARVRLRSARNAASALLSGPPPRLPRDSPAAKAWRSLAAGREIEDPRELAAHVQTAGRHLLAVCQETAHEARETLASLDDEWRPVAARLQSWLSLAREVPGWELNISRLSEAYDWLRAAARDLRNERLGPFAEQTAAIWCELRQESNVALGPITLAGSGTSRKVVLDVSVDGSNAAAVGVMSQGELHALALALFLPRATAAESPFRFVVIDDPVQSMDPAKVDGLARVLSRAAADRQVIVFTHDNRLADAVRRLRLPATIWEVVRREHSQVELKKLSDPVERALQDARSLLATSGLPPAIASRVAAGLCRGAIEAAIVESVRRRACSPGASRFDADAAIAGSRQLIELAALALFGDRRRAGDVMTHLNRTYGSWAGDVVAWSN